MPGSSPPSATPRSALTATKDPKLPTKPRHMVNVPQVAVKNGSHIFGDMRFNTRLLGNSLKMLVLRLWPKTRNAYLAIYVA